MPDSKLYGGRDNYDNYNSVQFTSLVTDNITINKSYLGTLDISGQLRVAGDIKANGNVYSYNSYIYNNLVCVNELYSLNNAYYYGTVDISGDTNIYYGNLNIYKGMNIKNDMSVKNRLYLGYNDASNVSYLRSDGSGHIGINTDTPATTMDIYDRTSPVVLTVRSDTSSNYNVLARNNTSRGIVLSTNASASTIDFYNDRAIYDASGRIQLSDGKLQYQVGGDFVIDVSNNTSILSNLVVSNRSATAHVANETMVVYDLSAGNYLYDVYESSNVRTGNAWTAVSADESSNTFVRIVTPKNMGIGIGGGTYPNNANVSYGSMGVFDASGTYRPSLNMARGNSRTQKKTTVGVNTYAPILNDCVMHINGPIYLTNGEITKTNTTNFEITNMSVSRIAPNACIAVGTPYTVSGEVFFPSTTISKYSHKIVYSKTGGDTWLECDLSYSDAISLDKSAFIGISVYDACFAIMTTNINTVYTNTGGVTWKEINQINTILPQPSITYNSVYIDMYMRIFMTTNDYLLWYDAPSNIYTLTSSFSSTLNTGYLHISDITIAGCNGYESYVYVIGNHKIKRFNRTNNVIDASYAYSNTSYTYKSVSAYATSVVAVGTNLITWSADSGFTWTTLVVPNTTFNSVYVYDLNSAIAVGNNGVIYCAMKGISNWMRMPSYLLNTSGNASQIIDPSYTLSSVIVNDGNRINLSKVITPYNNNTLTRGNTVIFHAYLPNAFNVDNNVVLDACGSIRISGNLQVNDGKISSTSTSFSLLNNNVKSLTIANDASMINIGNNLNSRFTVNRDMLVAHDLSVNGNVAVSNRLYSAYYEGVSTNTNIHIGSLDLSSVVQRTIFIGNDNSVSQNTNNIIKLGGGNDTVIMPSRGSINVNNINTGSILYINRLSLGGGYNTSANSSQGTGIHIVDNSNLDAGLLVVSNDMSGYIFKAPGSANKVKLDVNSLNLSKVNNINRGILTLATTNAQPDSSYTVGLWSIDASNLLLKNYSLSNIVTNQQVIDTSLGILGNTYVSNHLAIGKTANTTGINVDVSGNLVCSHLGILTNSVNSKYSVEISGNIYQNPGYIWQF
jgi:hypothetical protein